MTCNPTIIPTHACFDDALDFFALMLDEQQLLDEHANYRVAHGVCVGALTGEEYAHAWVEQLDAQLAWQAGKLRATDELVYFALPIDAFRTTFRVRRYTRYTLQRVAYLNQSSGHYGPWHPEYRALCNNGHGQIVGSVIGAAPAAVVKVSPARLALLQALSTPA